MHMRELLTAAAMLAALAACRSSKPQDAAAAPAPKQPAAPVDAREQASDELLAIDPGIAREASTAGLPPDIRPYDGPSSSDPRWRRLTRQWIYSAYLVGEARAAERAGLTFLPERRPQIVFHDAAQEPAVDVAMRLVDGVRRPVLRISAPALLRDYGPYFSWVSEAMVEAALRSAAGERAAPRELSQGLGLVLGDGFDQEVYRRAFLEPSLPLIRGEGDPLLRALGVMAIERIGTGATPLARYVRARLDGRPVDDALASIGIDGEEFLAAARETERERLAERLLRDPLLGPVLRARRALDAGNVAGAEAEMASVTDVKEIPDASDWSRDEANLVLAEIDLRRGRAKEAWERARSAFYRVSHWREARILMYEAEAAVGDAERANIRHEDLVADYPELAASLTPPPPLPSLDGFLSEDMRYAKRPPPRSRTDAPAPPPPPKPTPTPPPKRDR